MIIKTAKEMLDSAIEEEMQEIMNNIYQKKMNRRMMYQLVFHCNRETLLSAGYKVTDHNDRVHIVISW